MFSIEEIKRLMKEMDASSISELTFESGEMKLKLKKANASAPEASPAASVPSREAESAPLRRQAEPEQPVADEKKAGAEDADASLHKITSPMVGTFYASSSPDADPFVQKGSRVDKKTVVCIIEAMKLFNEIEAEVDGTIVDVLVENGQLVEYGQPLFLVKED